MSGKFELGPEEGAVGIDEGGAVTFEEFRWRELAIPLRKLGFVVEEFEVAGGTAHEEVDDALGLGAVMGAFGGQGCS